MEPAHDPAPSATSTQTISRMKDGSPARGHHQERKAQSLGEEYCYDHRPQVRAVELALQHTGPNQSVKTHRKRQRQATFFDGSSSGDDVRAHPTKKAPLQRLSPCKILEPLVVMSADLSAVDNYVHSAESKLNKTHAALSQQHLDKAHQAAQELSVQNAFLAGRCRALEEGAGIDPSITSTLATEIKKIVPSSKIS